MLLMQSSIAIIFTSLKVSYVTFGRLAVSDFELASVISVSGFELAISVIVLLIYCDVRFCILVHFRCGTFEKCRCRFCHMYI